MATRLLLPRSQIVAADGRPVAGAKLNTYESGTSTAKAVYSDAALTIAHTNPVVADSAGRFPAMFLAGGDYRTVLTDAEDMVIWTDDPVEGAASADETATATAMRNRLDNSAFQVSQEFGTSNTDYTATGGYPVDRWLAALTNPGPGGTLRLAQTASVTPGGSPHRLRATAQVSDGSIAAGDYYHISQRIEGARIADARFGSSSARQILVRLGVNSSIAGTFGVSLANSAGNRSYVGTITIAPGEAGTDVTRTLTIPGDTAGTWLTTAGIGMALRVCLSAGSTYQTTAGWQAGDYLTTSAQTNFMGTGGATFDLFDCGLYVDAAAAGVMPTWELPDSAEERMRAQRYFVLTYGLARFYADAGARTMETPVYWPVSMRAAPTVAIPTAGTRTNVSSVSVLTPTTEGCRFVITSTAAGDCSSLSDVVSADARL